MNFTTERLDGTGPGRWCSNTPDYRPPSEQDDGYTVYADTEADARAKMLIYLVENNLCSVGTENMIQEG